MSHEFESGRGGGCGANLTEVWLQWNIETWIPLIYVFNLVITFDAGPVIIGFASDLCSHLIRFALGHQPNEVNLCPHRTSVS